MPSIKELLRCNAELLRFLVSGVIAFLTGIFTLYLFTDRLGVWYLSSSVLAFIAAFAVSFSLQKFWTFQDKQVDTMPSQFGMSLLLAVSNLLINTVLMYVFVEYMHFHYLLAQVFITSIIAVETYFIYKYVIFVKKIPPHSPA